MSFLLKVSPLPSLWSHTPLETKDLVHNAGNNVGVVIKLRVGSTAWFAMASNNDHPSHQIPSTENFDLPEPPMTALHPLLMPFDQIENPHEPNYWSSEHHDQTPDFLGVLKNCMQEKGPADACWMSQDKNQNTVLHLAASMFNAKCVDWILKQEFRNQLLEMRNKRGEAPLDLLQIKLEKLRTQKAINGFTASISDRFKGHSDSAVNCLILLKGYGSLEAFLESQGRDAMLRLIRGCTCGQCLEGFLSPRMLRDLLYQAHVGHDTMNAYVGNASAPEWDIFEEDWLGYLPSKVLTNLSTNKSMRQGFVNLWMHVAACLEAGMVPNESNVLDVVRDASEWPPHTKNFLERGGTIESVFLAICRQAMDADEYSGDETYQEFCTKEISIQPECRNDLEFGYVSGMCGYRRISWDPRVDLWGTRLDEDGNPVDSLL